MTQKKGSARKLPEAGSLEWLVEIMARLLAPGGCPWDQQQTLETLKPYLVEETYELVDAIDEGDPAHHTEELGDLLFEIVFQAAVAKTPMEKVVRGIGEKLIRRHPHVFGQEKVKDADQVKANWEKIKREERGDEPRGLLDGVPRSAPALERAHRLAQRAAKVGFDWPDLPSVRGKVQEEIAELDAASASGSRDEVLHEAGDLLFAVAQWARKLGLDPEATLRAANQRFEDRFRHIETRLAEQGRTPAESSLEEMDRYWNEAKAKGIGV
jgi:tetrapyrrole methylase family protein / MazG family protein